VEHCSRNLATPLVFLDDILGSGEQFIRTWGREYGSSRVSIGQLVTTPDAPVWYVPLIATEYGLNRVAAKIPFARVEPVHRLADCYSATADTSFVWPASAVDEGREFIRQASARAGYPEPECWGFHSLALCLAVHDTIPDSALPLFYSVRNGWRPLMPRN
jgi:hypothetical protein